MTQQNMTPRRLVAVVVTHNRLAKLQVTLARLLANPAADLTAVVVVDNASTDGTGDWLATQTDPRLDIRHSRENLGGAGGFDLGMRRAMACHQPDWLVLMDDDGRPEPGTLAAFHALPDSRWDAIAGAVYFPSGEICEMNRPSRNPFWHKAEFLRTLRQGRAGFHLKPEAYDGPPQQIDVTSFVGFFISVRAIAQVGFPDPELFLYGDDGIYTLQLSKLGGRIGFEPALRFEHDLSTFQPSPSSPSGSTQAAQRGRFVPLWKAYYYHRNLLLLYRLAAGAWFPLVLLVVLPKWFAKARQHRGERRAFLRLMRQAVRDGLSQRLSLPHAAVLELAATRSSEYRGDSARSGSTPD